MDTKDKDQDDPSSGHFKNRLVGVIVFVALGVIFLPDVLDGKQVRQEEQFSEIPLRPPIGGSDLADEAIPAVDLSAKEQAFQPEPQTVSRDPSNWEVVVNESERQRPATNVDLHSQPAPKSVHKPINKAVVEPMASKSGVYTLQLGSFNNAANVKGLITKLRGGGFDAYTLPVHPVDGKLTKVFVGPEISKSDLESLQPSIEKLTKLKGRIVLYRPTAS